MHIELYSSRWALGSYYNSNTPLSHKGTALGRLAASTSGLLQYVPERVAQLMLHAHRQASVPRAAHGAFA